MSCEVTGIALLKRNGKTPASSPNHHTHPRFDLARSPCQVRKAIPCSRGSETIISISPITSFGSHRLAIGMNQAPVAQPCDHRRGPVHFVCDDVCALLVQTISSTRTTSHTVVNNDVAEPSASS